MRSIHAAPIAAAILSVCVALATFGLGIANPHDVSWLQGDAIINQFGLHQYLNDPAHIFPVVTDRASYPLPMSLTILGAIPMIDVVLKVLAPILPDKFQYIGLLFVSGVALQALLGWAVLREATPAGRGNAYKLSLFVGAVLFATAPVIYHRFYMMHVSLAVHWPVLLSLLIYLRSYRVSYWRTIRDFSLVAVIATGIMPYHMILVLLVYGAYLVKSLFDRSLDWPKYVLMVIPLLCSLAMLVASGLLEFGGMGAFPAGGFGLYSTNFFSMIDPLDAQFGAGLIPDLQIAGPGQYEGFGYVGAGVLFLFLASALVGIANRNSPPTGLARIFWPLLASVVVALLWAMSNKLAFGTYIVEVPLPEGLIAILQHFRSSGRFIAVVIYVLMFMAMTLLLLRLRPERAAAVFALAALLQVVDLAPPLADMHHRFADRASSKTFAERFTDPVYRGLGKNHETLLILPPWQCRDWNRPEPDYPVMEFVRFSNLAMDENLRTNSFYGGRTPVIQGFYHCEVFPRKVLTQPADERAVYLLTDRTFALYGRHIAATHSCDFADGMFICRGDSTAPGLTERARMRLGEPL